MVVWFVRDACAVAHRAPGGTCERGAAYFAQGRPWREYPFYDGASAGCGAAMRANCIGLALRGPERRPLLVAAAVESARLSHNHPAGMLGALVPALFTAYALERVPPARWGRLFVEEGIPLACKCVTCRGTAVEAASWVEVRGRDD